MQHYAAQGVPVIAVNRRRDAELEKRFPQVRFECLDVRDAEGVRRLVEGLAHSGALPGIFILNAGVNALDNDACLELAPYREALDINLLGPLHFAAPLTALGSWPHDVHVMAVSSTTNYAANPYCLGYYISKLALTRTFNVLSRMYAKTPLKFQWVVLGPVPTGINTSSDKFPKLVIAIKDMFSVSLERTVKAISDFASSGRRCLIFPWRAYVLFQGIRCMQAVLPGFYRGQKTLDGKERGLAAKR